MFVHGRDFAYSERAILYLLKDTVESLCVEITAPYSNVNVAVDFIYRPPKGDISFNDSLCDSMPLEKKKVLLHS